jgi:hypothetical protein
MANTYTLIASSTVGVGGAASIDFSSIPSTYTDLCLKVSLRSLVTGGWVNVTFNGSSANLSGKYIYANPNNAPVSGSAAPLLYTDAVTYTSSTFSNGEMYIPNYAGSQYKSMSIDSINENNATPTDMLLQAGLWSVSTAINQITLTPNSGTLAQYSTAYLYGVNNA